VWKALWKKWLEAARSGLVLRQIEKVGFAQDIKSSVEITSEQQTKRFRA
jgi:hypothetical protein